MKPNRIYITGLFLSVFLSGKAQRIEELPAVPLQIGYEKTLHLIFPTEVKYYSIGGDYVIGEKVGNCPEIIRLKAAEENFPGETTLSVVTADTKFYSYAISYNAHPVESYVRVDGQAPYTAGGKGQADVPHFPGRNHLCGLWQYKCGG